MIESSISHSTSFVSIGSVIRGQIREASAKFPAPPAVLYLYVPNCNATFKNAVTKGAKPILESVLTFWGDRTGGVLEPSGNQWWIAALVEDVSPDELKCRAEALE
jgi:uncharacterized glyoxalase superfamily protein PhnB